MTSTTVQVYRVWIAAKPEAIWEAITSPEWTRRYGYEAPSEYDLRPGGAYKGYPSEAMKQHGVPDGPIVTGEVIEVDPPRRLVQTWHMRWDPELAAEGPRTVTWEIEEQYNLSRLTVTHDVTDAPQTAAQVAGEVPNAGGGWSLILSDMKTLLETGRSLSGN